MSLLLQLAAVTLLTIHPKPGGAHDYVMSREQLTHEVENLRSSLSAKEDALKQEIQTLRQQGADQARTIEQLTQVVSRQNHAVAFSASFASGGSLDIGDNSPIKFNTVVTNIGNGYSTQTGVFTAPVAGTYGFFLTVKAVNIHEVEAVLIGIYKSGRILARTKAEGSGKDTADKGACFATTHLNVRDRVYARRLDGDSSIDKWHATAFSGFLITAD